MTSPVNGRTITPGCRCSYRLAASLRSRLRQLVHYVTDGVESAMRQAKEAAGDANVMVHGADLAQSLLRAGLLDELEIHLVPVLLGEGRRLFEHLGGEHVELDLVRVLDAPGVTHLHYRVIS